MSLARGAAALMLLVLTLAPLSAFAACTLSGNTELVSMTVSPATVTIDPNAAVGTVLATSSLANPSPNSSQVTCGNTTTIGVINASGNGQPSGGSTIYPTSVAGVGYRLLHPDSSYYLPPWGFDTIDSGTFTLSVGTVLQLVKTGPISGGSTLSSGTLGYWQFGGRFSNFNAETFALANNVKFVQPTCTVNTTSIAVTLPTVSNTALNATGQTAGSTAFNVGLSCTAAAAGQNIAIEFDPSVASSGNPTGVLSLNSKSTAKNLGVQLIDSNFQPLTLGTPLAAGTTPSGNYNLTYYARYYALSTGVTAGSVSASATFTISYP